MKKCEKCGALQKDNRSICIDCGERLGPPLSKEEENKIEKGVTKKIKKLSNRGDYFYISKLDRVIAILLFIEALLFLMISLFGGGSSSGPDNFYTILSLLLILSCAVDLMFPQISWELYKMKFIFSVNNPDDMEPSILTVYMRRIACYAVCVGGCIYLIYTIVSM